MKEEFHITDKWYISDVLYVRPDMTYEEAKEVLLLIEGNPNAEWGINWDSIRYYADQVKPTPDNLEDYEEE